MEELLVFYLGGWIGYLGPDLVEVAYHSHESIVHKDADIRESERVQARAKMFQLSNTVRLGLVWPFLVSWSLLRIAWGVLRSLIWWR